MPKKFLLAAFCCLFVCTSAFAHRVNIFAFVDGDMVQVECSFSRSQKVRFGELAASDAVTGESVFNGKTDEKGVLRFRPPQAMLLSGHDMLLTLNAGEGHRNQWTVSAAELAGLAPAREPASEPGNAPVNTPPSPAQEAGQAPEATASRPVSAVLPTDARELEALVGKVMDAKLAPIKEALGEMRTQGPGLKDIIGGLGWIFGLLGIAAYMKYRK